MLRAGLVAVDDGRPVAIARERGASSRTAAILALAAFALAAPALALRPQLFGIALFAVLLWLIAVRARSPAAVPAGARGRRAVGERPRQLRAGARAPGIRVAQRHRREAARTRSRCGSWCAGTLATLVNPYFAGAWAYAVGIGANPAIAGQVSEWQRTSPFAMPGLLFYPSVVITVVLMVRRRDLVGWPDWVLVAAMALMGAWAVRGVAWWAS